MTPQEFVDIVRRELGLTVTPETLDTAFDALPGWDSLHLVRLVPTLERHLGRRVPVADILTAGSLAEVHAIATATT